MKKIFAGLIVLFCFVTISAGKCQLKNHKSPFISIFGPLQPLPEEDSHSKTKLKNDKCNKLFSGMMTIYGPLLPLPSEKENHAQSQLDTDESTGVIASMKSIFDLLFPFLAAKENDKSDSDSDSTTVDAVPLVKAKFHRVNRGFPDQIRHHPDSFDEDRDLKDQIPHIEMPTERGSLLRHNHAKINNADDNDSDSDDGQSKIAINRRHGREKNHKKQSTDYQIKENEHKFHGIMETLHKFFDNYF